MDIIGILVVDAYQDIPVIFGTGVDIGANTADSPIYSSLCQSIKLISFEPFPKKYEFSQEDIKSNNFFR